MFTLLFYICDFERCLEIAIVLVGVERIQQVGTDRSRAGLVGQSLERWQRVFGGRQKLMPPVEPVPMEVHNVDAFAETDREDGMPGAPRWVWRAVFVRPGLVVEVYPHVSMAFQCNLARLAAHMRITGNQPAEDARSWHPGMLQSGKMAWFSWSGNSISNTRGPGTQNDRTSSRNSAGRSRNLGKSPAGMAGLSEGVV